MEPKPLPSRAYLNRLLRYEPDTGKLYWKRRDVSEFRDSGPFSAQDFCTRWNTRFAGKEAFTAVERRSQEVSGYRVGIFKSTRYKAHRIIWKMVRGSNPQQIDHIDGNTLNNRIENLRSVTNRGNSLNQRLRSTNTSGINGVRYVEGRNLWEAKIKVLGRFVYLGRFSLKKEAVAARRAADKKFGFHRNHGAVRV